MRISEAARRSGLSAKTVRYYEQIGLIGPADRGDNGYRRYDEAAIGELRFLSRAREVGFDLAECRQLLRLYRDTGRESRHARALVLEKAEQIDQRVRKLEGMKQLLLAMADRCNGDEGPECAILDGLGADTAADSAAGGGRRAALRRGSAVGAGS